MISILVGLSEFQRAYIEAALFTEFEDNKEVADIHPTTIEKMKEDCDKFVKENTDLVDRATNEVGYSITNAGNDFWLTRNGHGAGFWDGDLPKELGEALTKAADKFGRVDLYEGDDDIIYQMGQEPDASGITWEKFSANLFEYENCAECGKGAENHIGVLHPVTGLWFAKCKEVVTYDIE